MHGISTVRRGKARLTGLSATVALVAGLMFASMANATIIYDEAVSGDLDTIHANDKLQLVTGLNRIRGSLFAQTGVGGSSDGDYFEVLLGGGLSIVGVDVIYSGLAPSTATSLTSTVVHLASTAPFNFAHVIGRYPASNLLWTVNSSGLPLTNASYFGRILPSSVGGGQCSAGCSWNYEIRYTVTGPAVIDASEPGLLGLMAAGLLAVWTTRRRRR